MLHPIDIITKDGRLTGRFSDPEEANNKGFWHRGAHAIIYTPDGQILVQKRSLNIVNHPGQLDISVGGFVDSHETPDEAIIREIKEETGLIVSVSQLLQISKAKYNHHWKYGNRRKIGRVIVYTYLCRLETVPVVIIPQRSEVDWIQFLPLTTVRSLIRNHYLKRFGWLSGQYSYYRKVFIAATHQLHSKE